MEMIGTILELFKLGGTIFTQERQRKFEKGYYERLSLVDAEKAKRWPYYKDSRVRQAQKDLSNYETAYAKELRENIQQRLSNA